MALHGLADQALPALFVAHIQALETGPVAQFRGQRLAFALQQVGDDHSGTFLDEQSRGLRAHAARAAGNDGDLVCQTLHAFLLD
ncbi:hypothetical protein D3C85_1648260 [compost metagenome]